MAYGEIKVDTITFTDGGIDKSVSISGLVQNPTFSGNITVTGTISGNTLQGQTVSGVTVTGTTAAFTSGTFVSLTGATIQGTTATYTTGSFTSLTGTTTTGTTANFASGVFTTQISGATITGNTASFTTVTGGTATLTSGVFASGTAAAPSVSVGTTDNGIYSPGTDQVAISTSGTGRLFVDSSGKVGLGTSSPGSLFTLAGSSPAIEYNDSAGSADNKRWSVRCSGTALLFQARTDAGTGGGNNFRFNRSNENIQSFQANAAGAGWFVIDNSTQHVGVGTTSPSTVLHIADATPIFTIEDTSGATASVSRTCFLRDNDSFQHQVRNSSGTFTATAYRVDYNATGIDAHRWFRANTLEAARIDSSGRLGVGTASPSNTLHVAAAANHGITLERTGAVGPGSVVLNVTSFGAADIKADNAVGIQAGAHTTFSTNGANERARIDSSGRLGVGTTTPQAPLSISNGGANGIEIYSDYTGTGQSGIVSYNRSASQRTDLYISTDETIFVTGGSERCRLDASGRLLVGTSTSLYNACRLQIVNDSTAQCADFIAGRSDQYGPNINLTKSRGSTGSPTVVASGDELGTINFIGYDGSAVKTGASIVAAVDGTPGASDMPGRLVFSVTADGASSPTEAMRIKNSRILNFANTPVYADNAAAKTGGLVDGDVYRKSDGTLMIVYT